MVDVEKSGNGFGAGMLGDLNAQDAQRIVEQTKVAVDQALDQASEFIRERPIVCLAGALGVGYVLGGGLFSPVTGRLLKVGVRLALLPLIKSQLGVLAGDADRSSGG